MIKIATPGRICFFGDHQDYLGLPVIAGTINRYIHIKAKPIQSSFFEVNLLDFKKSIKVEFTNDPKTIKPGDYFRSGLYVLGKEGIIPNQGYSIDVSGDLPINAGLSSSSSLVIGWIRFLVQAFAKKNPITDLQIAKWAVSTEVDFFNQPGGIMDQYTISIGGLLAIDTSKKTYINLKGNLGSLLVIDSGIPKNTLGVLKDARLNAQKALEVIQKLDKSFILLDAKESDYIKYKDNLSRDLRPYWKATILNYMITKKAIKILEQNNSSQHELSELMNSHQALLSNEIQNTPEAITNQIKQGIKAGAYGSKIVGSGGGGCMVAMVNPINILNIKNAFLKAGAKDVFEVNLTN
jgi:galactokinase